MKSILTLIVLTFALMARAELKKDFPAHWGEPPKIQTRDYRPLPEGYGFGSSTLANWITTNLARDTQTTSAPESAAVKPLFVCDFSDVPEGALPESFFVIQGEFEVKADGTNKLLELPGSPVDGYSVLFGPVTNANVAIEARILSTAKGRRMPTFGVGLGGVAGYKLQIAPAKDKMELLLDTQVVTSAPFDWKSGTWTHCQLQIRQTGDAAWRVEARAWNAGDPGPESWLVTYDANAAPIAGQASVLGSPFSGTPIQFDDLRVSGMAQSKSEQLMK